jgi:hypothetical protein
VLRALPRQRRSSTRWRPHVPVSRARQCSGQPVLGGDRIRPGNLGTLPKFDAPHRVLTGQGIEQERRWLSGSLLWSDSTRRPRVELALHTEWSEVVPVVPILRPPKRRSSTKVGRCRTLKWLINDTSGWSSEGRFREAHRQNLWLFTRCVFLADRVETAVAARPPRYQSALMW